MSSELWVCPGAFNLDTLETSIVTVGEFKLIRIILIMAFNLDTLETSIVTLMQMACFQQPFPPFNLDTLETSIVTFGQQSPRQLHGNHFQSRYSRNLYCNHGLMMWNPAIGKWLSI